MTEFSARPAMTLLKNGFVTEKRGRPFWLPRNQIRDFHGKMKWSRERNTQSTPGMPIGLLSFHPNLGLSITWSFFSLLCRVQYIGNFLWKSSLSKKKSTTWLFHFLPSSCLAFQKCPRAPLNFTTSRWWIAGGETSRTCLLFLSLVIGSQAGKKLCQF